MARIGQQTACRLPIAGADLANLQVTITDPDGKNLPFESVPIPGGDAELRWTPRVNGPHQIRALLAGQSLPGFPATEIAFDPSGVSVQRCTEKLLVGQPVIFEADTYRSGSTQVTAAVLHLSSGVSQAAQCQVRSPYIHTIQFTPARSGQHELQLFLNGQRAAERPQFSVASEIDAVIVSENEWLEADKQQRSAKVTTRAAAGSVLRSQIDVNADLNRLDFDMPDADYPDSPAASLRSRRSNISEQQQQQQQQQQRVEVKLPRHVPIHQTIEFLIGGVPPNAQFAVHVQNPLGHKEKCDNRRQQNRLYVTFTPRLSGAHRFFVEVNNRYVSDLDQPPFCLVFDWTKIVCKLKSPVGFLDEPISLEVDASKCGGGAVDCSVRLRRAFAWRNGDNADAASIMSDFSDAPVGQSAASRQYGSLIVTKPDDRYQISFNPDKPGEYELHVNYDGHPVPESPFVIPVVDFNELRLSAQGLKAAPLFAVAWFRVELLKGPSEHLSVTVTSPLNAPVNCTLTRSQKGQMCEWTADTVGIYHLQVFLGDRELNTDTFTCHVYDISKVKVTSYDKVGLCGQRMQFRIESAGASGDGKSEIAAFVLPLTEWKLAQESRSDLLAADAPGLPLSIAQQAQVTSCEFVPVEGQQHVIEVFFNQQALPQCPIMVYVLSEMDVLNQMQLPPSPWVPVRTECHVTFLAKFEDFSLPVSSHRLGIVVRGPSEAAVPHRATASSSEFSVTFTPQQPGLHCIDASYSEQPIKWSPFKVNAYDPESLRVTFEPQVTITRPAVVEVDFSLAGEAPLQLKVQPPSGSYIAVQQSRQQNSSCCSFEYVPSELGSHHLTLLFNGVEVEGSPFQQVASTAEMPVAHGEGLVDAQVGLQAEFFVDPRRQRGDLLVLIDGPSSVLSCQIEPQDSGLYRVTYTPPEAGRYSVQVQWNGESIPGSPFAPLAIDPRAVRCVAGGPAPGSSQLNDLIVGKERTIVYDVSRAGPGRLSAIVEGPTEPLHCRQNADCISFTPAAAGPHTVRVWFGDYQVPGTPYIGTASQEVESDHTKVVLSGRGLREARVKEEALFLIDGSQAGAGLPDVSLLDLAANRSVAVDIQRFADAKYRCAYTVSHSGNYELRISWAQRPLRGSPFTVTVSAMSDAGRVVCSGEGLRQGEVGSELQVEIDARRAGEGFPTARCDGPTQHADCEIRQRGDATFSLRVVPHEAGKHSLSILFNGEHVPGSPFALRVSPQPDASRVRVTGPGVQHGVIGDLAGHFVCETHGAGAGQLTIRVRGPRGAFRVEMEREYQKDRTINCRYDPTEPGDYEVHVKWSGQHVPGSPFAVSLFNDEEQLRSFLQQGNIATRAPALSSASGSAILDY